MCGEPGKIPAREDTNQHWVCLHPGVPAMSHLEETSRYRYRNVKTKDDQEWEVDAGTRWTHLGFPARQPPRNWGRGGNNYASHSPTVHSLTKLLLPSKVLDATESVPGLDLASSPCLLIREPQTKAFKDLSECCHGSPCAEPGPLALWFQLALSDGRRLGWVDKVSGRDLMRHLVPATQPRHILFREPAQG